MPDKAISSLRQRMIDDMTARRFKEKVQKDCVRRVRTFTVFLDRSPDTATSVPPWPHHQTQRRRELGSFPENDIVGWAWPTERKLGPSAANAAKANSKPGPFDSPGSAISVTRE
jgi:hypothetical protein